MNRYVLKNIIFGIGIGLIIAAILNLNFVNKALTVQEIKNEAAKHNLIILEEKELIDMKQDAAKPAQ